MGSQPVLRVLQNVLHRLQMVQWGCENIPLPLPPGLAAFSTKVMVCQQPHGAGSTPGKEDFMPGSTGGGFGDVGVL